LPPVRRADQRHALHFPFDQRWLLAAWRALFFRPTPYRPDPARSAAWNRGAYLVQGLAHCNACHQARNALGALTRGSNPDGGEILGWYAPSLTRAGEASLHDWQTDDIVELLSSGQVANAATRTYAATLGPMAEVVFASLQHASAADLNAMALYLQSLPVQPASPERGVYTQVDDQALNEGRSLYAQDCASCHGQKGQGHDPTGPPLLGSRILAMSTTQDAVRVVLFGGYPPGTTRNPRPYGMPPFEQALTDVQIAEVLSYARASFAQGAAPLPPDEVVGQRGTPVW
jgi:mono/diheme cytochrome c family protein